MPNREKVLAKSLLLFDIVSQTEDGQRVCITHMSIGDTKITVDGARGKFIFDLNQEVWIHASL